MMIPVSEERFLEYHAKHDVPWEPFLSVEADKLDFIHSPEDYFKFLLSLRDSVKIWQTPSQRLDTTKTRLVTSPEYIERCKLPKFIADIPLFGNKAVPVTTYTEYFTNQDGYIDLKPEEVFESLNKVMKTSVYLYDGSDLHVYEVRNISVDL